MQAAVAAAVGRLEIRHDPVQELALAELAVAVRVGGGKLLSVQCLRHFAGAQAAILVLVQTCKGHCHECLVLGPVDRSVSVTVEAIHLPLVHCRRLSLRGGRNKLAKHECRRKNEFSHHGGSPLEHFAVRWNHLTSHKCGKKQRFRAERIPL
ncbi:hypothetical protein NGR_c19980 [Sinorhizobium fredii NGR234]|uniref:Uncharacterized protein n=1 Tax=Sinorhizobium fredii (strain NBRC 101917 / NGR234) TaxID=394 RepID=C3ME92_SINFN|nr:hypothetical protein NGR_c19980 [Sinorhizobium fredii NGR234]